MNKPNTNNTNTNTNNASSFNHVLTVTRATQFNDGHVMFDMLCDDIKLYNLRVVETKDKGDFVAFPTAKGKNGKYYSTAVWMPLSAAQQQDIISQVERKLQEAQAK